MIKPEVFEAVQRERQWQLTKHGEWHSKEQSDLDWMIKIFDEVLEAQEACKSWDWDETRKELLQVATLILAYLDSKQVVERNYESELTVLQNERKLDERACTVLGDSPLPLGNDIRGDLDTDSTCD